MEPLLNAPAAVQQAKASQKGLHWALEIVIFIAVFFVCMIGEMLLMLPIQAMLLMRDKTYLSALKSGNPDFIIEASENAISGDVSLILSLFVTAVMTAIVFLFCKFIQKRRLSSLGFVKKGFASAYLKGLLLGFLMFSAAVLICVLTGSLKLTYSPERFAFPAFLFIAAGYMVQGMAEEVLCRGYFMVSLGRRYPMAAAAVINATAFAAMHLFNPGISPLAVINLILFGIFASVCFIQTNNIWLIGALHSVWNLTQGNVYGIKVSGMDSRCSVFSASTPEGMEIFHGGAFGLEGGLAVTIVLMAGIAAMLFLLKNNKKEMAEEKL